MESNANWYIAKLVFEIVDSSTELTQFDEQWRMINASTNLKAKKLADEIGSKEGQTLERGDGSKVEWKFLALVDLYKFDHDTHGSQIMSRTEVTENDDLFRKSMLLRAEFISSAILKENHTLVS